MLDIKQEDNQDEVIYQILGRGPLIWRTVDQIAEEAGLPRVQVLWFLRDTDKNIVQSNYTNAFGEARFSTWDHYYANASFLQKLRGYLGNGVD
jgi:hypothetical protein